MNLLALASVVLMGTSCPDSDVVFNHDEMTVTLNNTWCLIQGDNTRTHTIKTKHGPVVVRHVSQDNPLPDILEVIETPPGYVAVPWSISVEEHGRGQIHIMEYTGL